MAGRWKPGQPKSPRYIKRPIARSSLRRHTRQHRHRLIDLIDDEDVSLSDMLAMQAAHILSLRPFPRDGHREEQCVEPSVGISRRYGPLKTPQWQDVRAPKPPPKPPVSHLTNHLFYKDISVVRAYAVAVPRRPPPCFALCTLQDGSIGSGRSRMPVEALAKTGGTRPPLTSAHPCPSPP